MASILFGVGVLTYDRWVISSLQTCQCPLCAYTTLTPRIKNSRDKRRALKESNDSRFSELEKDNAERIAWLQTASRQEGCQCDERTSGHSRDGNPFGSTSRENLAADERRSSLDDIAPPKYEAVVNERKSEDATGKKGLREKLRRKNGDHRTM